MNYVMKSVYYKFFPTKVYALIGRSGTGKSFRAQYVARKRRIHFIIDDGLLIKDQRIIAGSSAKQESNFLTAVKRALFQEPDHQTEVMQALDSELIRKILIIGTSYKMVMKIASRLELPTPKVVIHIEDIASKDEIDTAMRIRYTEGKHVIPVPSLQITRSYPAIVYDAIKVAFSKKYRAAVKSRNTIENTLVRPSFSIPKETISETAFTQMISQCLSEYENTMKIQKVSYLFEKGAYNLEITIRTPQSISDTALKELEEYISDSLERYGGILISGISIHINLWS